jgi:hypothetical protein
VDLCVRDNGLIGLGGVVTPSDYLALMGDNCSDRYLIDCSSRDRFSERFLHQEINKIGGKLHRESGCYVGTYLAGCPLTIAVSSLQAGLPGHLSSHPFQEAKNTREELCQKTKLQIEVRCNERGALKQCILIFCGEN